MKRLVITGLPCPPETWEKFLGKRKDQRIIPIYEVFENSRSSDLREMANYVAGEIEDFAPESIIAHDLGVPLTLLALMKVNRRTHLRPKVTLFNGAFRKVDIFAANLPFRVQFIRRKKAVKEVESRGGKVDLRLKKHMSRIRAMYRLIILFGLTEKLTSALGLEELIGNPAKFPLKVPVQMIVSKNDPYIPYESIRRLRADCSAERFFELEYGHFPYTISRKKVIPLIDEFEAHA